MPVEMLPLVLAGVGLVGFAYSISMAKRFAGKLVEYQYENHRDIWISDGRPPGEGESKKEVGFGNLSSIQAGGSLFWRWYQETPDWAIGDINAVNLLARLRRWTIVAICGWILGALGLVAVIFQTGVFDSFLGL